MATTETLVFIMCSKCTYGQVKTGEPTRPRTCGHCRTTEPDWKAYMVAAIPYEPM
jgi:hypothetical protein